MFTNFNGVNDTLRIIKSFDNGSTKNKIYKCTITSRTCHRTCEDFRRDLYEKMRVEIEAVMEYHSKSVKIHCHGYCNYDLEATDVALIKRRDNDVIIEYDTFTLTLHDEGISPAWNSYCKKQVAYTLEYNQFVKQGLWFRFHKWGKRTKCVFGLEIDD